MKALVQEMVTNFSRRLEAYGLQVRELTGDQQVRILHSHNRLLTLPLLMCRLTHNSRVFVACWLVV